MGMRCERMRSGDLAGDRRRDQRAVRRLHQRQQVVLDCRRRSGRCFPVSVPRPRESLILKTNAWKKMLIAIEVIRFPESRSSGKLEVKWFKNVRENRIEETDFTDRKERIND